MGGAVACERWYPRIRLTEGGCWRWTGCRDVAGYSRVNVNRSPRLLHRLMFESLCGPIREGLELDHVCRNRWCVNPEHLDPVTTQENLRRSFEATGHPNGRKTHCPKGHPYSEENTHLRPQGWRTCRECSRHRPKRKSRRRPRCERHTG
jgi:hypothetical protein